jgi:hypothetical protein
MNRSVVKDDVTSVDHHHTMHIQQKIVTTKVDVVVVVVENDTQNLVIHNDTITPKIGDHHHEVDRQTDILPLLNDIRMTSTPEIRMQDNELPSNV